MLKMPTQCPICGGELTVTALRCRSCGVTLQGDFITPRQASAFDRLTPEQLHFLEVFIRNEGKFSRMEKEMGLSYPTLRNRLRAIIRAMGYQPKGEAEATGLSAEARQQILDDLEAGKITAAEAARLLKGGE